MRKCDPIIDELRRIREDIAKTHDFDVRRIGAAIRQHENRNPDGLIRELPKPMTTRQKSG